MFTSQKPYYYVKISWNHFCGIYFQKQPPELFCRWVFLRTLKNSQENICAKVCFFLLYFFVSFFKSWLHAFNIFLFYHIDCFLNVCVSLLANAQSKQTSIGQLCLNNTSFYRHDHTTIPISGKCLHFIPPENTRKLKVSWCFQVV